jgi:hypothetical protein
MERDDDPGTQHRVQGEEGDLHGLVYALLE